MTRTRSVPEMESVQPPTTVLVFPLIRVIIVNYPCVLIYQHPIRMFVPEMDNVSPRTVVAAFQLTRVIIVNSQFVLIYPHQIRVFVPEMEFVIYQIIVFVIPDIPVPCFTIRRTAKIPFAIDVKIFCVLEFFRTYHMCAAGMEDVLGQTVVVVMAGSPEECVRIIPDW